MTTAIDRRAASLAGIGLLGRAYSSGHEGPMAFSRSLRVEGSDGLLSPIYRYPNAVLERRA